MDGEDKDGKANCFGSRPVSPSLMHGSIRSHSQQSFPSHPNSLNSDDERDHMGSDVEKDQRDEGKFFVNYQPTMICEGTRLRFQIFISYFQISCRL